MSQTLLNICKETFKEFECKIEIRKCKTEDKNIKINKEINNSFQIIERELILKHYQNFPLSNLKLIVIGSTGHIGYNNVLALAAEDNHYNQTIPPPQINNFIERLNILFGNQQHRCDYFCHYSKKYTLFLNVSYNNNNDNINHWIYVASSIRFINAILEESRKNKHQLAIIDVRQSKHIHQDDIIISPLLNEVTNVKVNHDDDDYQFDEMFKLKRENHFYIRMDKQNPNSNDEAFMKSALLEMNNREYGIDKLFMNSLTSLEEAIKREFDSYIQSRLDKNKNELNINSLRLLLTLFGHQNRTTNYWSLRIFTFNDRLPIIDELKRYKFINCEVDKQLYFCLDKKYNHNNVYILFTIEKNEALIIGHTDQTIQFLNKFKEFIELKNEPLNFIGISIVYDLNQKCFFLNQSNAIEDIVRKYQININENITAKRPINNLNNLFNSKNDVNCKKLVEALITNLKDIAQKTRPDICASVSILNNYKSKPLNILWNKCEEIVHYLWKTKNSKLRLKPSRSLNGFTDGSGINNNNPIQSNSKFINNQSKKNAISGNNDKEIENSKSNIGKVINSEKSKEDSSPTETYINRSQTGYFYRYHQCLISYASEHVQVDGITDSNTVYIELIGAARSAAECYIIKQQLSRMGFKEEITEIFIDNQIVLNMIEENENILKESHDEEKKIMDNYNKKNSLIQNNSLMPHLRSCLFTLIYLKMTNQVEYTYVLSRDNIADLFTKVKTKINYDEIRKLIDIVD